ncbi:hypothetical protein DID88_006656 [Monilinia fructigena]|uniref:Zn(2)-C6 fungal-type domain-containing protein n=1 Tax=Monilinia fructigena TaxID=38457 RepID=A0A395IGA5_9HELO|nr:hypothetical protein DID88_006656 [Monilinia fructigena]
MDTDPNRFELQSAQEDGPRPIKRARASKPKVKSGCITCKARRVKCDVSPSKQQRRKADTSDISAIEQHINYPDISIPLFGINIILQESHNVTSIRHAVIAIGALNKAIEEAPRPHLKVNVIQDINKKHLEFAVLQHLKAIQALNQYLSCANGPQLRTALMACLLFVCFETIQGSYASSVQQTYGGLKLLRSYYAGKPGSKPWIPRRISGGFKRNPQTDKVIAKVHNRPEYLETETPTRQSALTPTVDRTPTPPQRDYSPRLDEMPIPSHYKASLTLEQQRSLSDTPTQSYPSAYHTPSEYLSPNDHEHSDIAIPAFIASKDYSSHHSSSTIYTPESAHTPPSMGNTPPPTAYRSSQSPPILTNPRKRPIHILRYDTRYSSLIWDIHSAHHIPIPRAFTSFSEAQHCWDFLMDRTLQYYRRTLFDRKFASTKSDTPSEIAQQYASYSAGLNEFERAFKPILNSAISPQGKVLNQAAIVLITHLKATAITLSAVTSTSEMVYDSFMNDFQYIVGAAELLVTRSEATPSAINSSRFNFDIGIVPPLHVVATKCREPNIRRKAVGLLFRSPRQEGMWDGVLSARIGRWIISCEEDGLDVPMRLETPYVQPDYRKQSFQHEQSPQSYDELLSPGYWSNNEIIPDIDVLQENFAPYWSQTQIPTPRTTSPFTQARTPSMKGRISVPQQNDVWMVPEDKRFQLVVVDFHIQDRYIMVKCKRSVPSKDGTREERETIIAW